MSNTAIRFYVKSLNPTVGDLEYNASLILRAYEEGIAHGADVVIVNELATTGYSPADLLDRPAFCAAVERVNYEIIKQTGETALIFGSLEQNRHGSGPDLVNVALVAHQGQCIHRTEKQLLPTYDVFDEKRYFRPGEHQQPFTFKGHKIGLVICEDLWGNDNRRVYTRYLTDPVALQAKEGAEILISLSASPFSTGKSSYRTELVQHHAKTHALPMVDVNQAGANTELVFDGIISLSDKQGELINQPKMFAEQGLCFEISSHSELKVLQQQSQLKAYQKPVAMSDNKYAILFEALKIALSDYMAKTRAAKQVILGLSGGIDSALIAVIAAEALGKDQLWTLGMPSDFSSEGSISDAKQLAENLGIRFDLLEIAPLYNAYIQQLGPFFEGTNFGIAEENLQSRSRGVLLMSLANKFHGMVLNTGNKSEMATGYCTLYGDMNGGLSLIGDLYKTEVYALCAWLNEVYFKKIVIPTPIMTKAPSAELRPDQKDTDSLPPYELLDRILHLYIEEEKSRREIAESIGDTELSTAICNLVDKNEYKRYQAPPVIKLHSKSFGTGRRWPLVSRASEA